MVSENICLNLRMNKINYFICILWWFKNFTKAVATLFLPGNVDVVKGTQAVQNVDAVGSALERMWTTQSLLFWDPVEQVILLEWWG